MKKAWSYSAITSFETCPKRHYLTRVSKEVVPPEGEALIWGNIVHKAIEEHAKDGTPLPESCTAFGRVVGRIMKEAAAADEVLVEKQFALTEDFEETEWFAKDVWVRSAIDFAYIKGTRAWVYDWKTGKVKEDSDQLRLFAAVMFTMYPHVNRVTTAFVWLTNANKISRRNPLVTTNEFTREHLGSIWSGFAVRAKAIDTAFELNKWPARPSGLCRNWCPVTRAHCQHCGV